MNAPAPGTPEWLRVMTASKVAAVLGVSPWESPRSLWHTMRGDLPHDSVGNDAMRRGHYVEPAIVAWWCDRHPELAESLVTQHYAEVDGWAAATLDGLTADDHGNVIALEVKSAASDDEWGQPGTDEIPAHYLAQVMWQLWASGAHFAYVAVLFGTRLRFEEYVVQRDDALIEGIVARCREFYDSLAADEPPPLDDSVATYEAIRKLHPDIDRKAEVELTEREAFEYVNACALLKDAERRERTAKAVVLERMGRARIATHAGQVIARRQPNKYGVSLVAVAKPLPESENVA